MLTVVEASEDEFSLFPQRNIFSSTDAQWTQILLLFCSQDQGFDRNLLDSEQQINGRLLNSSNVSKSTLTVFPIKLLHFYQRVTGKEWTFRARSVKFRRYCSSKPGLYPRFLSFYLRCDSGLILKIWDRKASVSEPGRRSMLINSVRCLGLLIAHLPSRRPQLIELRQQPEINPATRSTS